METKPSQEAIRSALKHYNAIQEAHPDAVTNFERKWEAAQAVCHSLTTSSKDDRCTRTKEYNVLKRLGPKIIQMVVSKLALDDKGERLWSVFLYNALENDYDYRLYPDECQDLQQCSARIIELNYQRNKILEERIAAWKQVHIDDALQSCSGIFTGTDEYDDLLEMGTSIIGPIMVAYHENQTGYWWELLHEIIHGRKMGAVEFVKPVLYEQCRYFFVELDHYDAPEYILTPLDRLIRYREYPDPGP